MILSILEIFFLMALVMLFESQTEGFGLLRAPAREWDHCDASAQRPARCWSLPVHPAVRPAGQEGTNSPGVQISTEKIMQRKRSRFNN